jgi:hypothetical protein
VHVKVHGEKARLMLASLRYYNTWVKIGGPSRAISSAISAPRKQILRQDSQNLACQ